VREASFADIVAALHATLRVDVVMKGSVTRQFSGT
jgi:hypothetical protein